MLLKMITIHSEDTVQINVSVVVEPETQQDNDLSLLVRQWNAPVDVRITNPSEITKGPSWITRPDSIITRPFGQISDKHW